MTDPIETDALTDLLDMIDAGDGHTGSFLRHMRFAFPRHDMLADLTYNGSLDAAKALHEAVLPRWTITVAQNMHHKHWNVYVTFINRDGSAIDRSGYSDTNPARAWLIAIIKALIAELKDTQ